MKPADLWAKHDSVKLFLYCLKRHEVCIVHVPDFEWSIHGRPRLLATLLLQLKYLQEEQNFSFLKIVLSVTNLKKK